LQLILNSTFLAFTHFPALQIQTQVLSEFIVLSRKALIEPFVLIIDEVKLVSATDVVISRAPVPFLQLLLLFAQTHRKGFPIIVVWFPIPRKTNSVRSLSLMIH
jgi:hypothetical protein